MDNVKGVYVLIISVNKDVSLRVGALGKLNFEKGFYAYVGSAQINLGKRVNRHLGKIKRNFWHIDYLLGNDNARVLRVFFKKAAKPEECRIAGRLSRRGIIVEGFGSSDCNCKSHLFKLEDYEFLGRSMREL